jgi:hypothetical protein
VTSAGHQSATPGVALCASGAFWEHNRLRKNLGSRGRKRPTGAKARADFFGVMRGLKPPPPSVWSFSTACETPASLRIEFSAAWHSREFSTGYCKDNLPAGALRCSIRVAYQAADASHPMRVEQARRRARKFRRTVHPLSDCTRRRLP